LHLHKHPISIHDYICLYIENEEEVAVEEEIAPPPEDPPARNCFYFDICRAEPDSPITQGKPDAFATSLLFKNLSHLLDALGDRSCVLYN
jgi:hypothetical protein